MCIICRYNLLVYGKKKKKNVYFESLLSDLPHRAPTCLYINVDCGWWQKKVYNITESYWTNSKQLIKLWYNIILKMSNVLNTKVFKEVTPAFYNFLNVYLIRYYISMLYDWMWVWFCFLKTCNIISIKYYFFLIDTVTIINIHSEFYSYYLYIY